MHKKRQLHLYIVLAIALILPHTSVFAHSPIHNGISCERMPIEKIEPAPAKPCNLLEKPTTPANAAFPLMIAALTGVVIHAIRHIGENVPYFAPTIDMKRKEPTIVNTQTEIDRQMFWLNMEYDQQLISTEEYERRREEIHKKF